MKKKYLLFILLLTAITFKVSAGTHDSVLKTEVTQWISSANRLRFIEDKGQMMDMQRKAVNNVLFKVGAGGMDVYVTTGGLSYVFIKTEKHKKASTSGIPNKMGPHSDADDSGTIQYCRADMELAGADIRKENIIKEGESTDRTDYYYGGICPNGILNVHSYGKVTIKNIYPGIDWVLYTSKQGLKYDFTVHPGADPSLIRLKYKWTDKPQLQTDGSVKISTPMGNITEGVPISYKEDNGSKVETKYRVYDNEIKFDISKYNTIETLVIDPTLTWATYCTGNGDVGGMYDDGVNVWVVGETSANNFPTLNPGGGAYFQGVINGANGDAFILKFDLNGVLKWGTFYGGTTTVQSECIYSDGNNVWTTGWTNAPNFPTYNPGGGAYYQATLGGGSYNAYVVEFDTAGVRKWASYFGGNKQDLGLSIQSDRTNVWLTGETNSPSFPTLNPGGGAYFQGALASGFGNAFIAQFNMAGVLKWSTYYGGTSNYPGDIGHSIYSDGTHVWVAGSTSSPNLFTLNPGGGAYYQGVFGGTQNSFILKFNTTGVLKWATYYGGNGGSEAGWCIYSDGLRVWMTGQTSSTNLFTLNPGGGAYFQGALSGGTDAFILEVDTAGAPKWSTYYGGSDAELGYSIQNDGANVWLCGSTSSTDFPTLNTGCGFFQDTLGRARTKYGINDIFISQFSTTGVQRWSTYYGNDWEDDASFVSSDRTNLFVAGDAGVSGYPAVNPGGATYYYDTVVAANQEDPIVGKFIIVGGGISVAATSVSICRGDSARLNAFGAVSYSWSPPTGLSATNIPNPKASPKYTTTYTVTGIDTGTCAGIYIDSVKVTVDTLNFKNLTVSKDSSICAGDSITLRAGGGATYTWSNGGTSSNISISNDTATHTYTVIISNGACKRDTGVTITVLPNPTIKVSGNKAICKGDSVQLTVSGGIKYLWSNGNTTTTYRTGVLRADSTIHVIAYNALGCPHDTSIPVHVDTLRAAITNDTTICSGSSITLSASGGTNYNWNTGSTTSSTFIINDTITRTYTVSIQNGACVKDTEITVKILALPKPLITGTTLKCLGATDTFLVSSSVNPTRYKWENGSTSTSVITGTLTSDTTIYVTAYNNLGCPVKDSFEVMVKLPPSVAVNPPTIACSGSQVLLKADAKGTGPFTYTWTPGGKTTDTITVNPDTTTYYSVLVSNGCDTLKTTEVMPDNPTMEACCNHTIFSGEDTLLVAQSRTAKSYQWSPQVNCLNPPLCDSVKVSPTVTTTYTVISTDSAGCQVERILTIVVEMPCSDMIIPNVFTPNNAGPLGLNSVFYIKTDNLNAWSITIYDRWGKEMYNSANPNQYWDGNTEGGGKAPDGVYYYIINATCQGTSYKKDGFVQLIR